MIHNKLRKDLHSNWEYYLLLLPVLLCFLIFQYLPMYGIVIGFKDMKPGLTMHNSPWVGLKWFGEFIESPYFWRSLKNTIVLSFATLLVCFPVPIIFALALNEVKNKAFKKFTQSASYFPYFISTVIIVSMMYNFLGVDNGIVNNLIEASGGQRINFFNSEQWFIPMYVLSELWQTLGWSAIIYIAALTSIDPTLYEASKIDGAGRIRRIWHICLPGIKTTIVILLLLRLGNLLNIGFEKVLLIYNPAIYNVADILSTFIYREGILNKRYSYATAIGLFNQVISFAILIISNKLSRKFSDESLW